MEENKGKLRNAIEFLSEIDVSTVDLGELVNYKEKPLQLGKLPDILHAEVSLKNMQRNAKALKETLTSAKLW